MNINCLGLCFSNPVDGLIQHDITDSKGTMELIKQLKPNLGINKALIGVVNIK